MSNARALPFALSAAAAMSVAALANARASGVAIDVDASAETPVYSVYLMNDPGTAGHRIAATPDETAARRIWSLLSRALRVPRFVAGIDGGFRPVDHMVGPLVCRPDHPRRDRRVALRRRPLSRRWKAAAGPSVVHAGEREIICYE